MSNNCPAFTKSNTRCTNRGRKFEGYCGIHHRMRCESDPEFKARWDAFARHAGLYSNTSVLEPVAIDPDAAASAAAAALRRREIEERLQRAQRTDRVARLMTQLTTPTMNTMMGYATKVIALWRKERIPGLDIAKAYAIIKHNPLTDLPAIFALTRAIAGIYFLSDGYHPIVDTYAEVPADAKELAFARLRTALEPFAEIVLERLLPRNDNFATAIIERIQEEADRLRRIEHERRRLAEEERRRQFALDLRERPVVFRRDPEGSIDIRAFATDSQNIHRSSVQNATHKACLTLLRRPLAPGQETLPELVADLENPAKVRVVGVGIRERMVLEVTHDYFETEAFSLVYGDVLDRVWAFIRGHEHRGELCLRLAQEIAEGLGQCSNGKMARLVNSLQGFDETLELDPPKELFQNHIAMLRGKPVGERSVAARALFVEYAIPEAEQGAWLEALLDEDPASSATT